MNVRRAAVLAFVSWYLMIPDGPGPSLPNGQTLRATFETQSECEKAAAALRSEGYSTSLIDTGNEFAGEKVWQQENAKCIHSGNPRRKKTK